jgi:ubiquinone/menaquinone biosynthesis C-methylase UbiE
VRSPRDLAFRAIWRAANEAARFRGRAVITGRLERPDRWQAFSRWVDVRGWAVAQTGDTLALRITLNGRVVKEIPAQERPDIVPPGLPSPGARVYGFEDVVPLEGVGLTSSYVLLTASAVSVQRPSINRTLGVAFLKRRGSRDREVPRHAYQQTWDAVSRSVSDARYSVAGTADQGELDRSGQSSATDVATETRMGPNDRVLEIGCGVGRIGAALAPRCREWVGADVSRNMLAHAREALASHKNVGFLPLNGIDLAGLPDAWFDVVYCTAVFMHLEEWDRFRYVREAARVLKPGGRIYFDNISLVSSEGWKLFEELVRYDPAARPPNISKASTPEELRTYAERCGFVDIRVRVGTVFITVVGTKPPTA